MTIPHMNLPEGLNTALRQINSLRNSTNDSSLAAAQTVESIIDHLFYAGRHLAIYGSLAPGKPNHTVVESIHGEWLEGVVHGTFHNAGWGSRKGYPGMTWNPNGQPIPVRVLKSEALVDHWQRLDDFEGSGYRRILVPVDTDDGALLVANIYEVRL